MGCNFTNGDSAGAYKDHSVSPGEKLTIERFCRAANRRESYYALGSGGLFGVGVGNSRQKYLFLPFAESDFILSVIGEEIGFVGILLVVALFLFIVVKGWMVAVRAKDRFSSYLATGITAVLAVQTALNIAVVCGAIPPTGLPLPFVSAGGSSLVAHAFGFGSERTGGLCESFYRYH